MNPHAVAKGTLADSGLFLILESLSLIVIQMVQDSEFTTERHFPLRCALGHRGCVLHMTPGAPVVLLCLHFRM